MFFPYAIPFHAKTKNKGLWDKQQPRCLLFIPSCGFSLAPPFKGQEKAQGSTHPAAERPKALAELSWSPEPAPADSRRVLSAGMGAHVPGGSLR